MAWWVRREVKVTDGWVTDARKYRGPFDEKVDAQRAAGLADSFNNPRERHIPWEES